jgi:hypothetical protein
LVQAEVDGVADGDFGGAAEDFAGGVGGDGVAAFEDAEGTAFVELKAKAVEALAFVAEAAIGASGEFELESIETESNGCDFHSEIEGDDALVRDVEALGAESKICAESVAKARSHFVGALALLAEQVEWAAETAAGAQFVHATA